MRTILESLLVLMLGLGVAAASAAAEPAAAAAPNPSANVVLQLGHKPSVAALTPDGRFLVTASATARSLLVRSVATGEFIAHAWLPQLAEPDAVGRLPPTVLTGMEVSADGTTAVLRTYTALAKPGVTWLSDRSEIAAWRPQTVRFDLARHVWQIDPPGVPMVQYNADGLVIAPPREPPRLSDRSGRADDKIKITNSATGPQIDDSAAYAATPRKFVTAELGPDGATLAVLTEVAAGLAIEWNDFKLRAFVEVQAIDASLGDAGSGDAAAAPGQWRVRWIGDRNVLVSTATSHHDRDDALLPPPRALLIERGNGGMVGPKPAGRIVPPRCFVVALGTSGMLAGAGLENCRATPGQTGLWLYPPFAAAAGKLAPAWQPLDLPALRGRRILNLAAAPDGRLLAVGSSDRAGGTRVIDLIDPKTQQLVATLRLPGAVAPDVAAPPPGAAAPPPGATAEQLDMVLLSFSADGKSVLTDGIDGVHVWTVADAQAHFIPALLADTTSLFASDGSSFITADRYGGATRRFDMTGRAAPSLAAGHVVAGGFVSGQPLAWAVTREAGLYLWTTGDWHKLLSLFMLETPGDYDFDSHAFVTDADARYDSDLGPTTDLFRWVLPDAPWTPLPPQTFMRSNWQPGLWQRKLDCARAGNCATALKPVVFPASINTLLPQIAIAWVRPGERRGTADVCVDAHAVRGAAGAGSSGLHALRLLRDGALVGEFGAAPDMDPADRTGWAQATAIDPIDCTRADARLFRGIALPTIGGFEEVTFEAYAFNADQIKSATSPIVQYGRLDPEHPGFVITEYWSGAAFERTGQPRVVRTKLRAAPVRHKPRAYVIAIGVNTYAIPGHALRFAVNDALAMARAFGRLRDFDTVAIALTATPANSAPATRAVIRAALALLAGGDAAAAVTNRAVLTGAGLDPALVARLRPATPDDAVIITFAGHGSVDAATGRFFLLPADTGMADGALDPASMISAADLAVWMRGIDAHEIAMIIDACHSGASVTEGGFRPGPFGDPGLGQLAFDKGIRILAATQAADVALEDPNIEHGILTYTILQLLDGKSGLSWKMAKKVSEDGGRDNPFSHSDDHSLGDLLFTASTAMPELARARAAEEARYRDEVSPPLLVARIPPPAPRAQEALWFDYATWDSWVMLPSRK